MQKHDDETPFQKRHIHIPPKKPDLGTFARRNQQEFFGRTNPSSAPAHRHIRTSEGCILHSSDCARLGSATAALGMPPRRTTATGSLPPLPSQTRISVAASAGCVNPPAAHLGAVLLLTADSSCMCSQAGGVREPLRPRALSPNQAHAGRPRVQSTTTLRRSRRCSTSGLLQTTTTRSRMSGVKLRWLRAQVSAC